MRNTILMLTAGGAVLGGLACSTSDRFLAFFAGAAEMHRAASNSPADRQRNIGQLPVLELFTSQGCSSCPPADRLASRIAAEGDTLIITRPVTYWDRLGWRDTLARKENTDLQRAYARQGFQGAGVYTPQLVIEGRAAAVGGREAQVRQLARQARGNDTAVIAVRPQKNGGFAIGIAGTSDGAAELMLVALASRETVAIGRGENGGRRVTYTNVVRSEAALTDWREGRKGLVLPPARLTVADADLYALILREKDGGPVLAARILPT